MSRKSGSLLSFLAGAVVGGVIGAVTALLMAPKSGKETRTWVADKTKEQLSSAKEKGGRLYDEARETLQKVGEVVREKLRGKDPDQNS